MAVNNEIRTGLITCAPRSCCYKCGGKVIAVICHHCGRPICGKCRPEGSSGLPLKNRKSYEFAGLDMDKSQCRDIPAHCEDCFHVTQSPVIGGLIAIASLVAAALFVAFASFGMAAAGVIVCAAAACYGAYKWYRWSPARLEAPLLPVLPSIDKLRLRETLSVKIVLDPDNNYRLSQLKFDGQIEIALRLAESERLRLQKYRDRFKLNAGNEIQFNAGFVLLEERLGLTLPIRGALNENTDCVIPLVGLVSKDPFLAGNIKAGFARQPITIKYSLRDELQRLLPNLPLIRVIPCLVQQSGRKALEIELQWNSPDPQRVDMERMPNYHQSAQEVESMEWRVPNAWGSVTTATGLVKSGSLEGQPLQILRWEHETPGADNSDRHSFAASFEHEIGPDSVVSGRAQILLRGTFSGLEKLRLFYPLGLPQNCRAVTETRLILDFELNLSNLRSEELLIVSSEKSEHDDNKNEQDGKKNETMVFEGIIPDHLTIINLLDALLKENFYISDVRDNSSSSGAVADLVNRKWEISGRCYEGSPTDFHIVLIGDEVIGAGAPIGMTNLMLTVRGIYTSKLMKCDIENAWTKLERLIRASLSARQRTHTAHRASPPHSKIRQRPKQDKSLWKQREQLREALAEGRISEATYLQIQKELNEA
ncbi:MAG: zinc ribbon domain-containing protein [Blastocatellia bacterium]